MLNYTWGILFIQIHYKIQHNSLTPFNLCATAGLLHIKVYTLSIENTDNDVLDT